MTPVIRIVLFAVGGTAAYLSGYTQAGIIQTTWGAIPISLGMVAGMLVVLSVSGLSGKPTIKCGCGRVIVQDARE